MLRNRLATVDREERRKKREERRRVRRERLAHLFGLLLGGFAGKWKLVVIAALVGGIAFVAWRWAG